MFIDFICISWIGNKLFRGSLSGFHFAYHHVWSCSYGSPTATSNLCDSMPALNSPVVTALIRLDDCRFLAFDVIGQTVALRSCSFHGHSPRSSWGDNNNHSFLYRLSCISKHLQLRTGGFCWCKVLLPTCPCWRQPAHSWRRRCSSPQQCYLHCLGTDPPTITGSFWGGLPAHCKV